MFQSLQDLADSEDTFQQQRGQGARLPDVRNREHDRAATHRLVGRPDLSQPPEHGASVQLCKQLLSASLVSVG